MPDQAERLRQLFQESKPQSKKITTPYPQEATVSTCRTIAIASGKGGVGKTHLVTNLAIALADYKKKVLVLDGDMGLANIDVLLGITPRYNLQHVIMGDKTISDILVTGPLGIQIIPGATGIQELANLEEEEREDLIDELSSLENQFDIILIDTGAGLSQGVLSFVLAANEVIVLITPEPTSIMDAYSMIKVILKENQDADVKLVVNMAKDSEEANQTLEKVLLVVRQFLGAGLQNLGYIPIDKAVVRAVKTQRPFVLAYPYSPATRCVRDLAARISNYSLPSSNTKGIRGFLKQMSGLLKR